MKPSNNDAMEVLTAMPDADSATNVNWLTFTEKHAQFTPEPYVTHQKRGGYSLNQAAYELAGRPEFVELLYEPDLRMVGFRPSDKGTPHAYPVRKNNNSQTWLIAGEAFGRRHSIPHDRVERFKAEKVGGVLAIRLRDALTAASAELPEKTPQIAPARPHRQIPDDAQATKVG